ncbi:MAG: hypothetical protein KDA20_08800 [Phycisphaerales bacterium]|nr:hypothetical protein [Phycisphaerales bacterium]
MLLTLAVDALRDQLKSVGKGSLAPLDMPDFVVREFELRGLHVSTTLFAGWAIGDIDKFRDRCDKAGCPCLVMTEPTPLKLADHDGMVADAAADRVSKILKVAHRLGCASVAIRVDDPGDDDAFEVACDHLRDIVRQAERAEINLLVGECPGLAPTAQALTDLVRRVGGFRIGSFPTFAAAHASGDPSEYLRQVAPYATAISASGELDAPVIAKCVEAIRAVGFDGTLAIDPAPGKDVAKRILTAKEAIEAAFLEAQDA